MKNFLMLSCLLLTGCQSKNNPASSEVKADKPRHMLVSQAVMSEVPDQPGARQITWMTNYHSCDPFQNLTVKREGNTLNIAVLTTPPLGACTGESGRPQKNSITLPAGTFYTDRYQISEPVSVRLNGQEIGVVNPE